MNNERHYYETSLNNEGDFLKGGVKTPSTPNPLESATDSPS